jgi:hypothetical protein
MKTIKKFKINTEKVLKNEELVNLRGGDYEDCFWCNVIYIEGFEQGGWCCGPSSAQECEAQIWDPNSMLSVACE